ncbi:TFIIH basal transcription factor complex, subunit SSL1 [Trichodelitschia bisporula]|uniref:General transcription and DNA repair factor IIH n=1 Tax=Trichodelitschia bisporula TaxID=703511 RepID=A0A6G1HMX0_9PEZI|nr:TFIIH basal transcription factor complex, subunit SSL1 [Trichodelitschia bisporula]
MSDSDNDFVASDSENEVPRSSTRRSGPSGSSSTRPGKRDARGSRRRERWEADIKDRAQQTAEEMVNVDARRFARDMALSIEGRKRERLSGNTQPVQRGIMRSVVFVLDVSDVMLEKDFKPTRYVVLIRAATKFVTDFFDENPLAQLALVAMYDGRALTLSSLSSNPQDHFAALTELRQSREPKGSPSLQNALEMARAMLHHIPTHATREVIITLGALYTLDPGDIHETIRHCAKDKLRVTIIGLDAQIKICSDIVKATNSGDESTYTVALDQDHFAELTRAAIAPPIIRRSDQSSTTVPATLIPMGFPSRFVDPTASLCACHSKPTRDGYRCPRCESKVCALPVVCPACNLSLVQSTHLARSYHHLNPLPAYKEVSWVRAREVGSRACEACFTPFPPVPSEEEMAGEAMTGNEERFASQSSRYECPRCETHYCVDCDVFSHNELHFCPICAATGRGNGNEVENGVGNGAGMGVGTDGNGVVGEPMDTTRASRRI